MPCRTAMHHHQEHQQHQVNQLFPDASKERIQKHPQQREQDRHNSSHNQNNLLDESSSATTTSTSSNKSTVYDISASSSAQHEETAAPILPSPPTESRLRELVGDFGLTLFNPLACCSSSSTASSDDARNVWELLEEEGEAIVFVDNDTVIGNKKKDTPDSSLDPREKTNKKEESIPRKSSCATMDGSVASTAVTIPEFEEDTTISCMSSLLLHLEDEPAAILQECPRILSQRQLHQLHAQGLPESLQMCRWERCFAIGRDGDSFYSLLERVTPFQRTFVVIQTTTGHILGGYASMPWRKRDQYSNSYFGTGQCFLFASHPQGKEKQLSDEHANDEPPLHLYRWTGTNDFCQICDPEEGRLGMGGGCDFGFLVQDDLQRGRTGPCGTFGNPALTTDCFDIQALEIYGLRPFGESVSLAGSPILMQTFFG